MANGIFVPVTYDRIQQIMYKIQVADIREEPWRVSRRVV